MVAVRLDQLNLVVHDVQASRTAFWRARYAVVSDPDGNGVGIMSPVDPARRSEPPTPG